MLLPAILIAIATLSAAIATFGTSPQFVTFDHGLQIIEFCRRAQWPLFALSLILCMALTVLVVTGKRRIFWLLGFAPVFALFLQHFVTGANSNLRIIDSPSLFTAQQATFMQDDEHVVGVIFNDQPYAFPYRQLLHCPVVIVPDREKRMALFWSAFANRALACSVTRQFKARELDIVSQPANALLIYNSRVGEFINGFTGLTASGAKPSAFGSRIHTTSALWRDWKALHPQTHVTSMPTLSTALPGPVRPLYPMRSATTQPAETRVILFEADPPVAVVEDRIGHDPTNLVIDDRPIVLFRDANGQIKAFERRFSDLESRFLPNPSPRRAAKGVFMLDIATNSGWTINGLAVDGDPKAIGQKLPPITAFDEGVYWGVVHEWYPGAALVEP